MCLAFQGDFWRIHLLNKCKLIRFVIQLEEVYVLEQTLPSSHISSINHLCCHSNALSLVFSGYIETPFRVSWFILRLYKSCNSDINLQRLVFFAIIDLESLPM